MARTPGRVEALTIGLVSKGHPLAALSVTDLRRYP
jgi:hypothetical protein